MASSPSLLLTSLYFNVNLDIIILSLVLDDLQIIQDKLV